MTNFLVQNITDIFSNTLVNYGGAATTTPKRIPMSFTSTYRLRQVNTGFAAQVGDNLQLNIANTLGNANTSALLPVIAMSINPNSITWRQPKRIIKRDVQNGSVYFHFSDVNGANNDILELDFRGNTGNINPAGDTISQRNPNQPAVGALEKQLIWHNLWALTREPMLLSDGTVNRFQISYQSVIIPVPISLFGFFKNTMDWTDSAEKPFSKDYSFTFVVQQTDPPLDQLVQAISTISIQG